MANWGYHVFQGDVGPSGPPGPIGETGYGLPGPKVGSGSCRKQRCTSGWLFDPQVLIVCRAIEVKQVRSAHLALKETVSLDPWWECGCVSHLVCSKCKRDIFEPDLERLWWIYCWWKQWNRRKETVLGKSWTALTVLIPDSSGAASPG